MKKLLFSAALLVFAANVWAEPVEINSKDMNRIDVAKAYNTEIEYPNSHLVCKGSLADDGVVKFTTKFNTKFYKWYKIKTGGKPTSEMRGLVLRISSEQDIAGYLLNDSGEYVYLGKGNWISNSDNALYDDFGEDYTGDLYLGIYSDSDTPEFKLQIANLGEERMMYPHSFEAEYGVVLYESVTNPNGKPESGDICKYKVIPDVGYELNSDIVFKVGDFEICHTADNTFVMPKGEISVSATFTKTDEGDEENPNPDNGGNQNPTGVEDANVSTQSIVGEKFHTVLGQPLTEPQTSGVTVVTRTYSDGSTSSSKEVR